MHERAEYDCPDRDARGADHTPGRPLQPRPRRLRPSPLASAHIADHSDHEGGAGKRKASGERQCGPFEEEPGRESDRGHVDRDDPRSSCAAVEATIAALA